MINAAFFVGLNVLGMVRGFAVAGFLATTEFGLWGLLFAVLGAMLWLRDAGIADKYVQQEEEDQETAFHRAFTLNFGLHVGLAVLMLVLVPLFALALDQPDLTAPGLVLAAIVPAYGLRAPAWVFLRRMDFFTQRVLQAIEPVVALVVMVGLAAAGAGVWALVIGAVVGAWASAIAGVVISPYRLRLKFDRLVARDYFTFSWPLLLAGGTGLLMGEVTVISGEAVVGLAGVGAITLAGTITRYTTQIDDVVTQAVYPAVCRVRDRADLLFESFIKANRLALMWGIPFGVGVVLFMPDLVTYVLGEKWRSAVLLMQVAAGVAAAHQVGFSWSAYFRAKNDTRPVFKVAGITLVAFFLVPFPGLLIYGLDGLAAGTVVMAGVHLAARTRAIKTLFPTFSITRQAARGLAPVVPGVAAVLLVDLATPDTAVAAVGAAVLFLGLTAGLTYLIERRLVAEMLGYLRRRPVSSPAPG